MLKLRMPTRMVTVAAATVALVTGVTVAGTGTANADWRHGEMYNYHTGKCLDGGGGWLTPDPCSGSSVQIWNDISSTVYYQLQDNAGLCIDSGQSTGLFDCNGGDYQLWSVSRVYSSGGRVYDQFRNVHYPNMCLDAGTSNGMSDAGPCNQGDWQWWSWN